MPILQAPAREWSAVLWLAMGELPCLVSEISQGEDPSGQRDQSWGNPCSSLTGRLGGGGYMPLLN